MLCVKTLIVANISQFTNRNCCKRFTCVVSVMCTVSFLNILAETFICYSKIWAGLNGDCSSDMFWLYHPRWFLNYKSGVSSEVTDQIRTTGGLLGISSITPCYASPSVPMHALYSYLFAFSFLQLPPSNFPPH